MTPNSKDGAGSARADFVRFVRDRVSPLSEEFAGSSLMQLRVTTSAGSVTFVKKSPTAPLIQQPEEVEVSIEHGRAPRMLHEYLPDGEPGRAYDTVCADVVGIFRAAPDLPLAGGEVEADRVLGSIEALKLRTPVTAGFKGRLIGQIAEDGQPVDFGEALFVIDRGPAEALVAEEIAIVAPAHEEPAELIEPPRI